MGDFLLKKHMGFDLKGADMRLPLILNLALLDTGMNQTGHVSRKGKRPFAPTQIHTSTQQRP
jgi:hypothetical protein